MAVIRATAALLLLLALAGKECVSAQNVIGIDFGSEWIKLAVVQRSAGVQIVLNEATKRKSPNALMFGQEQREFGDTAMVKPHLAITHTRELLGKGYSKEVLEQYGPHYFPYEIIADEERGAVKIKEGERYLSPEALVAMMFTYAKSLAQAQTGEKAADCVITVPAFYRQFTRQAILDAAQIAGLNVLSLMNDHTAVALKYGIDHNVHSLEEPLNVMFYDMGSTATRASVVQFSSIPDKEAFQKNKTLGQLKVLGVSWDESLGGTAFSGRVADVLKGRSKKDPDGNNRAWAKLLATSEKTKVILSANKDAHPTIESFIDDYDFRGSILRAEFEDASKDLFERVGQPIKDAIAAANVSSDDIHRVEVVGGGWRIPKIQDIILAETGKTQLQKTMNADEAFCFGAALYAASLSTAFRLRKFGVHDMTSFPVSIDIDSLGGGGVEEAKEDDADAKEGEGEGEEKEEAAAAEASSSGKKNIKLFKVGHKIPAKRLLTFKRDEDLTFTVKYDDDVPSSVPRVIAKYNITGVKQAIDKYPNGSKPKINVSFRLTRSGLVDVDKAEAAIEEMVEVEHCENVKIEDEDEEGAELREKKEGEEGEEKKEGEEEKKEGEEEKKEDEEAEKKEGTEEEAAAKEGEEKKEEAAEEATGRGGAGEADDAKDGKEKKKGWWPFGGKDKDGEGAEKDGEEKEEKEEKGEKAGEEKEADDKDGDDKDGEGKKKKDKKKKKEKTKKVCTMKEEKRVRRVALQVAAETPDIKPFNATQITATKKVLREYDEREAKIRERASAFNALESYIYVTKEKLEDSEELKAVTTAETREKFTEQLTAMSGWLDEDGWEATTEVLTDKLNEMKLVGDPMFFRMKQTMERPEAVAKAREMISAVEGAVANLTKKMSWLNESHTQMVTNKTAFLAEWLDNMTAAQEATPPHEDPAFTAEEVYRKFPAIEDAMKRLQRVPKPAPPKKEKKEKKKKDENATDDEEGKAEAGEEKEEKEKEEKEDEEKEKEKEGAEEAEAKEEETVKETESEL